MGSCKSKQTTTPEQRFLIDLTSNFLIFKKSNRKKSIKVKYLLGPKIYLFYSDKSEVQIGKVFELMIDNFSTEVNKEIAKQILDLLTDSDVFKLQVVGNDGGENPKTLFGFSFKGDEDIDKIFNYSEHIYTLGVSLLNFLSQGQDSDPHQENLKNILKIYEKKRTRFCFSQ